MTLLAADAPAWQTWLPTLIGVLVTACGAVIAAVWVKRMNRRLDDASADKAEAEGRKAAAEAVSVEVATARSLIAEIRAMMDGQREAYEGQLAIARAQSEAQVQSVRAQHQADMRALTGRLTGIEKAVARHREWDDQAAAVLRTVDPAFPSPPPVDFD